MADNFLAIPTQAPQSHDVTDAIHKLASYVKKNGVVFEDICRQKEKDNPKFKFLSPGDESYYYYKWALLCSLKNYGPEQIKQLEESFRQSLLSTNPGHIDICIEDNIQLMESLRANHGSKEQIRSLRKWILDRAHSCVAIGRVLYTVIKSATEFIKMLHCVYVINDVFFNSSAAKIKGPYTSLLNESESNVSVPVVDCIWYYLGPLMQVSYRHATTDGEKDKLIKIIALWETRGFIDSAKMLHLRQVMTQAEDVVPLNIPTLLQPYAAKLPTMEEPTTVPAPPSFVHSSNPFQSAAVPTQPPMSVPMPPVPPPTPPHQYHVGQGVPPLPMAPMQIAPSLTLTHMLPQLPTPPAPPLLPSIDLQRCTVGSMANLIRAHVKMGHKRYAPLDTPPYTQAIQQFVEPGRLEARINEFYRRLRPKVDDASTVPGDGLRNRGNIGFAGVGV